MENTTQVPVIKGDWNANTNTLEWTDPNNQERNATAWGEFATFTIGDAWFIVHDVLNDDGVIIYTVEAPIL